MKPEPDAEPIKRILSAHPGIECVRIDREKHRVDRGFADQLPPIEALQEIAASVSHELPNPASAMHPQQNVHCESSSQLDHQHHCIISTEHWTR